MQGCKVSLALIAFGIYVAAEGNVYIVGEGIADRIGAERAAVVYIDNAACRKFERIA